MPLKVTTLQFAASTGGGTQNVAHGHGTTPEAALFFFTKATSLETARANSNLGVGFSDGTTHKAIAIRSQDNQASTNPYFICADDAIVISDDSTAATDGVATASFGATNLTLTWSEAPSVAFYIQAIFFSGTDGVKVLDTLLTGTTPVAISHNLGLSTSNEALIFCIGNAFTGSTWDGSTRPEALFSFGVSHWDGSSTFTNRAFGHLEDNAETDGRPLGYLDTSNLLRCFNTNYTELANAAPSNFQTNNFDMTGNSGATDVYAFLVVGLPAGVGAWVGDISAPTTLGSQAYTPLSWEPQHVGMFTTQIETRDSRRHNLDGDEAGAFGISGLDSSQGLSACWALENDAATTNTQSTVATKAVYMPAHDGTLAASASAGNGCHASLTSLDSTGWTIDTTGKSANSTQTYWIAWALESEASGPVTHTGTGVLQAGSAAVAGIGTSTGAKQGTGVLQAQDAAVAGVGVGVFEGTGALQAQSASVSGAGAIVQDGTGALQAQDAAVSGIGELGAEKSGSGTLQAQDAAVSGAALRIPVGTGALQALSAAVSGEGITQDLISGTGVLQAQPAAVVGFGEFAFDGTGTLQAQSAVVAGTGFLLGELTLTPADLAAIQDAVWAKLVNEGLVGQINELWQRRGLDPAAPQTYDKAGNQIRVGGVTIDLTGDQNAVTQTRQP